MRRKFIAGNWKMHLLPPEARALARAVKELAAGLPQVDVAVAPTFAGLAAVAEELKGSRVGLAAQNCHWEIQGAFTGEVSAEMLRALGATHVIVGHSERRQLFGETDETVNKKTHAAHRAGLKPIVCVGETLAEREAGRTLEVVERQVRGALREVAPERMPQLTLAYEPVWAIGTGKVASPAQAQEVHARLRELLGELYGRGLASEVRLQYGGSVKPDNVKDLMAQPDIDGALVGGASLKADSFAALLRM
ncbi:MAG TPA: triose-phosphate isomerase [Myxococcota bacterium]|nr:triose-phosphate isomerase [Myxococcota bacterium]HRY92086.1 triose-phosphate isomerase [Myxococcota bacterium]HSA22144.1 triose-phosphate isomerase [Myxococcota bacterium]